MPNSSDQNKSPPANDEVLYALEQAIVDLETAEYRFRQERFGCVWEDAANDCHERAAKYRSIVAKAKAGAP